MESLFDRLDQAWNELIATPTLNTAFPDALALAGDSDGWDQARAWLRRADPETADRVIACLCAHARDGEPEAAQIVLSLLTPGMVRLAASYANSTTCDVDQVVVSTVWEAIVTCSAATRDRYVVRFLLRRARRALVRAKRREVLVAPDTLDRLATAATRPDPNPGEELLGLLADCVAESILDPHMAALIGRWRIAGASTHELALDVGRDRRTVSHWRCLAEKQLLRCAA